MVAIKQRADETDMLIINIDVVDYKSKAHLKK